jgi:Zn-dependent protease with chaperone function
VTRVLFGLIVAGAAGTAMLAVSSVAIAALWRGVGSHATSTEPARLRALRLALWRLFPAVAALAAGLTTLVAFLRHEPVNTSETLGLLLPAACVGGLISIAAGMVRASRALLDTGRVVKRWTTEPTATTNSIPVLAVDGESFPIVTVVGIWKPRLFVARQVVARCDPEEIDAMIAHEMAHVAAGDNVTRLLFRAAPAAPFMPGTFEEIEREWVRAAEEAADEAATRDPQLALALASALTKVARLATGPPPLAHASAVLTDAAVEHRVRRLLGLGPQHPASRVRWAWPMAIAMPGVALSPPVLRGIYDIAEYCVQHLP